MQLSIYSIPLIMNETVPKFTMTHSTTTILIFTGLFSHLFLFKRGEWHMRAVDILLFANFVFLASALAAYIFSFADVPQSLWFSFTICGTYCSSLFTSIIIYRCFLHRLSKFPGPALARVTKLWHVYHCLNSQNHLLMMRIHKQYGDIVRTGKNFFPPPYDLYSTRSV